MSSTAEQTNDGLNEARRMLKVWADWLRTGGRGLCRGYPKSSAFTHADEVRGTADLVNDDNLEALAVENAMCRLKILNKGAFKALICEYCLELSNREAAERLKVCEKTYKHRRAVGENVIAGIIMKRKSLTGYPLSTIKRTYST